MSGTSRVACFKKLYLITFLCKVYSFSLTLLMQTLCRPSQMQVLYWTVLGHSSALGQFLRHLSCRDLTPLPSGSFKPWLNSQTDYTFQFLVSTSPNRENAKPFRELSNTAIVHLTLRETFDMRCAGRKMLQKPRFCEVSKNHHFSYNVL